MNKILLLVFFIVGFFSCSKNENKQMEYNSVIEAIQLQTDTLQLQKNILEKGDINSFKSLMMVYETPEDSLSYKIFFYYG